MNDVILHHYPQSPVTEKVRVVFGIKQLKWRSVEVPRIPPKPKLMPLTGGYRRTPVMQIGADVYCDTACINREIERRFPEPTLYPGGADGMVWGLSRWTDVTLMDTAVAIVLGPLSKTLPPEFADDRGRLYFGPDFNLDALGADVAHHLAQLRGQLVWINDRLSGGRQFMLGDAPGLPDALTYYIVWFIRGRYEGGPALLDRYEHLLAWEKRVRDIGHGEWTDLSEDGALKIALESQPAAATVQPGDPRGLEAGMRVSVVQDGNGGDPEVEGELVGLTDYEIAIKRNDPQVGEVVVHFPQVGYRVTKL